MVSKTSKKASLKKREALERGLRVEELLEIGAIQSEAALASTDRPVDDSHIDDILSRRSQSVNATKKTAAKKNKVAIKSKGKVASGGKRRK